MRISCGPSSRPPHKPTFHSALTTRCGRAEARALPARRLHARVRQLLRAIYTYLYTALWLTSRSVGSGLPFGDLRAFPEAARREAGYQLRRLQQGLLPGDWKPIISVGPGVAEIRIHSGVEHRVFYVAKYEEAVYVLHAFEKRTRQTRQADLKLATKRLADVIRSRRRK